MPRLKKTDAQRRAERLDDHYRTGKAHLKLKEPDIAVALGIGEATLYRHRQDPDKLLSLGEFARLGRVFGWSDEDYLDIINGGRGGFQRE